MSLDNYWAHSGLLKNPIELIVILHSHVDFQPTAKFELPAPAYIRFAENNYRTRAYRMPAFYKNGVQGVV